MNKHRARDQRRRNEIKRQVAAHQKRQATPAPPPRETPIRLGTPGPLKVNVIEALGLALGLKSLSTYRAAGRWLNHRRHKR